jgi:hypothetical protein
MPCFDVFYRPGIRRHIYVRRDRSPDFQGALVPMDSDF